MVVNLNEPMEMKRRKEESEVHQAGMFYYHIEDPMLDYEEEVDSKTLLLRELAWNGLVNSDPHVVELQDGTMEKKSDVLPVTKKKDGTFYDTSSVAKEEEFIRLSKHVQKKLSEYGKRILKGEIAISPYELGAQDACAYCDYHSVCGFDRKLEGCCKRRLVSMGKQEIWDRLKEEEEE